MSTIFHASGLTVLCCCSMSSQLLCTVQILLNKILHICEYKFIFSWCHFVVMLGFTVNIADDMKRRGKFVWLYLINTGKLSIVKHNCVFCAKMTLMIMQGILTHEYMQEWIDRNYIQLRLN